MAKVQQVVNGELVDVNPDEPEVKKEIQDDKKGVESSESLEDKPSNEGDEGNEDGGEETPFWLQEEDDDDKGGEDVSHGESGDVPVAKHIDLKKKLKGTIREQNDELEKLREENQRLKQQSVAVQGKKRPVRPSPDGFASTKEFTVALDKYEDELTEYNTELVRANAAKQADVEKTVAAVNQSIDDHYSRAEKLVTESKIDPEVFQQADIKVKQALDTLYPGKGELTFNHLVHTVGAGSEKVMLYIGRNAKALKEFTDVLAQDATGLRALYHLGRLNQRISGPVSKTSRAPKPAANLTEQQGNPAKASKLREQYNKAHKENNAGAAYKVKQQAKASGIDVSQW